MSAPAAASMILPASLLATKSDKVFELLTTASGHTVPYASQSDGMTSLSTAFHSGGLQTSITFDLSLVLSGDIDPHNICVMNDDTIVKSEKYLGGWQEWIISSLGYEGGSDIPGFIEYNHMPLSYGGVLKSDPTKPCPLMSTSDEKKDLCLSVQESVWGSHNFRRLSDIKNGIDPNNRFEVYFGIGNDNRAGPMSDYCAPPTNPTVPVNVGWDSSEERVTLLAEECKVNTTSPTNLRAPFTKEVDAF